LVCSAATTLLHFEVLTYSERSFISLLLNQKGLIRWCLWLSWLMFFLGCIATTGTGFLIWDFQFGARDCTTDSSGQITCQDLRPAFKIPLTVAAVLGCWIQLCPCLIDRVFSRILTPISRFRHANPPAAGVLSNFCPRNRNGARGTDLSHRTL